MRKKVKEYHQFLRDRFRGDIASFIVELAYVLFCLSSAIYFLTQGKLQNVGMSLMFPLIVLMMCLLEWKLKFRCGALFYLIFFSMCTSNILGDGYGLYAKLFPYFDKIMHTFSGIVFTCLGYTIVKIMFGGDDGKKFGFYLFLGFAIAMGTAAVWEMFEYFVTVVLHNDMQTNYIVDTVDYVKYISQTYIYYTDGSFEVVDGYIDVGLFDTLQDILVCFAGSLVTIGVLILDRFCLKSVIYKLLMPEVLRGDAPAEEQVQEEVKVQC